MHSRGNSEFKQLIEEVYKQKSDGENYTNKMIEETKFFPSFYYNEQKRKIRIELKEDEINKEYEALNKFYNDLQNKQESKTRQIIIKIEADQNIYNKILNKYTDIIYFEDKVNTKYYTKKYFKEKILVELKAIEDILEYAMANSLEITINNKKVEIINEQLKINFTLEDIEKHYYLTLEQNVRKLDYIIYTKNYIYICCNQKLYKCSKDFITDKYKILMMFWKNYKNKIYVDKANLSNFFSLIYPNIKNDIVIKDEIYKQLKKYIPHTLKVKMFLDFDDRNYLILDLKFGYLDIEFNPIENKNINISRNLLQETIFLNKLSKIGFLLDQKNKRFVITNDDTIYNFIQNELEEYMGTAIIYTTERFDRKKAKKTDKTSIGVKIDNNLLEINFDSLPINKEEIKDVLEKYRLNKKYYRLKEGSFINLENNKDIEFLDDLLDGMDISYKEMEDNLRLPVNRSLYLDKLLSNNAQVDVTFNDKYKRTINNLNNMSDKIKVSKSLLGVLRDYQKIGHNWLSQLDQFGFGGILADDMGLGKTIQLLSVLTLEKEKKEKFTSLVVAPSSLTLNWKSEAKKFASNLNVLIINGNSEEREDKINKINDYDLIITSYDLLKRDIDKYEDYIFRFVIADEAQYIKNNNTQNSRAIKRIKAKTKYALTGTPIENSLSELWSIFDFVMPGYLFTYKKFKKNYELPIVKEKNEAVLEKLKLIIEPFILRRTKKEVLKELPDKTTIVLNNEMSQEQEKIYLSYLAQARDELNEEIEDKGFEQSRIKILALLTRLRQICCHPSLFISNYKDESGKLNQCVELVKDGIQSGHKILLFSGYTSMFEIIEKELKKENITYLKLTGKTNVRKRHELIEEFNNNNEIKVFLISLKAGGTGINLTSADMVIHYDPWWNLSVENQATDRTHRIGQTKKVQVYKLITKNSIEEKIYDLQQRKNELIDNMLSTNTKFINKLSKEDILELFE